MKIIGKKHCLLSLFCFLHILSSNICHSEITLDGSLGRPGGNLSIMPNGEYTIRADMGKQIGTNLFHSFGAFNISAGQSANFTNGGATGPVHNILSRVTGGQPSTIDGLLKTSFANDQPNLFFMNPAGVIFGQNARLDVQGSFHVTTADYLKLSDGVRFAATPSGNDALLSVAPVTAFGFLGERPKGIDVRGSSLEMHDDKTLSLIGGDINIIGGDNNYNQNPQFPPRKAVVYVPGGRINLASTASKGEILSVGNDLDTKLFERLGNINISNRTLINTSKEGGASGSLFIHGGQFVIDNSDIVSITLGDEKGQNIDIDIRNTMLLDNIATIASSTRSKGDAGNINIRSDDLMVRRGSMISTASLNEGRGGDLNLDARRVVLDGKESKKSTSIMSGGDEKTTGDGGNVIIITDELRMNKAGIFLSAFGSGNAGNLTVKAKTKALENTVEMNNKAFISSSALGTGNAGKISIDAGSISLSNLSSISSDAGIVTRLPNVDGDEEVVTITKTGNAGNISIKANSLNMNDNTFISTSTVSPGKAGDISIESDNIFLSNNSKIASNAGYVRQVSLHDKNNNEIGVANVDIQHTGNAGNINITNAKSIELLEGGQISASTEGFGNGGNILIEAKNISMSRNNSPRFTGVKAETSGAGNGGNIVIKNTDNLEIRNHAWISSDVQDAGNGGEISIDAKKISLWRY